MFDLGAGELVLIVFVVLILFGPKKLPELAQSLGRGMREFKRAQREFTEQINQAVNDDHYKKQRGPELDRPEGSIARSGTRRLGGADEPRDDARRDDARRDDAPRGDVRGDDAPPVGELRTDAARDDAARHDPPTPPPSRVDDLPPQSDRRGDESSSERTGM